MEIRENQESSSLGDELRQDTGRVTSAATDRLQSEADSRKGQVAAQARAVSSAIGNAAEGLGADTPSWVRSAFQEGAKSIEQLAKAVEGKDSRELVGDVQQFARQRPTSFLAGCALLGFAASRVFKAGGSQTQASPASTSASNLPPQSSGSYSTEGVGAPRAMMSSTDAGGPTRPVSPQFVGTSL
jgi:hypothetical protein